MERRTAVAMLRAAPRRAQATAGASAARRPLDCIDIVLVVLVVDVAAHTTVTVTLSATTCPLP